MGTENPYPDLEKRKGLKLEPSGDAEHDRLTDEALGLDALAPERNAVHAEADAEALDDEEHSD